MYHLQSLSWDCPTSLSLVWIPITSSLQVQMSLAPIPVQITEVKGNQDHWQTSQWFCPKSCSCIAESWPWTGRLQPSFFPSRSPWSSEVHYGTINLVLAISDAGLFTGIEVIFTENVPQIFNLEPLLQGNLLELKLSLERQVRVVLNWQCNLRWLVHI